MPASSVRLRDIRRLDVLPQAVAVLAGLNFALAGVQFAALTGLVGVGIGVLNLAVGLFLTSSLSDELEDLNESEAAEVTA